jgi:hypothetical protein
MIRWRVSDIIERFADNGDDVLLANFERVRGFDGLSLWKKALRCLTYSQSWPVNQPKDR